MEVDWELSSELTFDSQGIRAACVISAETGNDNEMDDGNGDAKNDDKVGLNEFAIVTGNQGGNLCEFGIPSNTLTPSEYRHDHAVTALLPTLNGQGYISGCKDSSIRIFDRAHKLVTTLEGHDKPVTSLAYASTPAAASAAASDGKEQESTYLVSGSWDGTAKIWNLQNHSLIATLPDHENSVCVAGLVVPTANTNSNIIRVATGSAGIAQNNQISDHTVRIWSIDVRTGEVQKLSSKSNDHDGPIRDIALLPGADGTGGTLATCSNDGTVKLRSVEDGTPTSTLVFVQQQQQHPPMLLSVTSGQDILAAAAAEDGHVVIWNTNNHGGPQIILHPSCVWNIYSLPNGDIATCCQDGYLRIFTRATDRMAPMAERQKFAETVAEAHKKKTSGPSPDEVQKLPKWENNHEKWGKSEGQVQLFNKDGVAIAAQWSVASLTWIEVGQVMGSADGGAVSGVQYDHVFPVEIDQPGGGIVKLQIGYNNGENPFVAAQRFIDDHMLPQYHLNDIADFIRNRSGNETPTLGAGGNTSAAAAVATTGVPMVSYKYLPVPGYKSFELPSKTAATVLEKMKGKLKEFGKVSDEQMVHITNLTATLLATNRHHAVKVPKDELNVILDMIQRFPITEVFPALDLARLTVLIPDAADGPNSTYWGTVIDKAIALCNQDNLEGPPAVAIPMLSLRLFANCFRGGSGSFQAVTTRLDEVIACVNKFVTSTNKNVRLAVATVLYNVSKFLHSTKMRIDIGCELIRTVDTVLKLSPQIYETEAITRILISLGTASLSSNEAKETAKALYIISRVEMVASPHGDTAKAIAKEVYQSLS